MKRIIALFLLPLLFGPALAETAGSIPPKFNIPFGNSTPSGFIQYPIPQASQIGINCGAASLTDGFPPLTFTVQTAGGCPPRGQDFNGLFKQITQWLQWAQMGGAVPYDSTFQGNIGGYPNGAIVPSVVFPGLYWLSTADSNTTNPDTGGANWIAANRIRLGANATYYISASGSDSNPGTSGSPWLTKQHAYNWIQQNVDLNGFVITVQIANSGSDYTDALSAQGPLVGARGAASLIFQGSTTPSNVTLLVTGSSGSTPPNSILEALHGAAFSIQGVTLHGTTGNEYGMHVGDGGVIFFSNASYPVVCGQIGGAGSTSSTCLAGGGAVGPQNQPWSGGYIKAMASYSYTGNSNYMMGCGPGSIVDVDSVTITLVGSLDISTGAGATGPCYIQLYGVTFVGSFTGVRYVALYGGWVQTRERQLYSWLISGQFDLWIL